MTRHQLRQTRKQLFKLGLLPQYQVYGYQKRKRDPQHPRYEVMKKWDALVKQIIKKSL